MSCALRAFVFVKRPTGWKVLLGKGTNNQVWSDFYKPCDFNSKSDPVQLVRTQTSNFAFNMMQCVASFAVNSKRTHYVNFYIADLDDNKLANGHFKNDYRDAFMLFDYGQLLLPSTGKYSSTHKIDRWTVKAIVNYAGKYLQATKPSAPAHPATTTTFGKTWKMLHPSKALFFYNDDHQGEKGNYIFTNFFVSNTWIGDRQWKTTEHYYQAQKYDDEKTKEIIRGLDTPRDAFKYAKAHPYNKDLWRKKSLETMLTAVRAKFRNNPVLRKRLVDTHNLILVEDSPDDDFYGCGANGKGENMLGIILMHIRKELSAGVESKFFSTAVTIDSFI